MLTELGIRKLRPPKTGRIERYDGGVRGFGIRVTDRGVKTYVFLYVHGRRRRRYTIGRFTEIGLDAARARAAELRLQVRQGRDPAAEEKVTRALAVVAGTPKTFKDVVDLYEKRVLVHTRRGDEVRQTLDLHMVPVWGALPITAITSQNIVELVEAKIDAGHPAGARRVLDIAKRILKWAATRPELRLERSPGEGLSAKSISPSMEGVERDRTLSDIEWRALARAVQRLDYPSGPFMRLLMLTALRRAEVSAARWNEFDLHDKRHWTIPKERMKNNRAHIVPLTKQMVALIDALPRDGDFLFPSRNVSRSLAGYSVLKARLGRIMLEEVQRENEAITEIAHWTLHDIRRSIRTHLSMLPVPQGDITRELILAHTRPSLHRVYDKYAYLDERRRAYELWEMKLTSIIERRSADVVDLTQRKPGIV
jgi:integrase